MTRDGSTPGRDNTPEVDLEGCEKNHCHGRKRDGSGKACHRPAGWGTDHPGEGGCKLHLGSTRNHRVAAQRELARQAVQTYGLPRDVTPEQALAEEVCRTAGHVTYLEGEIRKLGGDELVWIVSEEIDRPPGPQAPVGGIEVHRKAMTHPLVALYQQERKHLASVAKAAIDAGVSERQVRVYEQVAASYVQVLDRVLDRLDLTEQQRALVPTVVQAELQAITKGAA